MYKRNMPTAPKANQTKAPAPKTQAAKPMKGASIKQGFTSQAQAKKK